MAILIGSRAVGPGEPAFVIAEAGVNHNGSVDLARRLVGAAADASADAVKFQTFDPDSLATATAAKAAYQREAGGSTQRDMLRSLALPISAWRELKEEAESRGLIFMSTPFDAPSLDLLVDLQVSAIKVSSGDLDNIPLLERIARCDRPVLLSTGMATLGEVATALQALDGARQRTVLLHCVSAYPASAADCNLLAIPTLSAAFGLPVGFSDHTLGIAVAVAAAALGSCVIEKHLTLDTGMDGPDHKASLAPDEFALMVAAIRAAESALGTGIKRPVAAELEIREIARRSLVAARDLDAGTILTEDLLIARRPAVGLSPSVSSVLVGRRLRRSVSADEPLAWSDVELA